MQNKAVITLVSGRVSAVANGTRTVPLDGGGEVFASLQNYDSLLVLINVTAAGTATGTVNIFLQDSWDNGTSWDDVVASAQLTLGTTAGTQRFWVQGRIAPATHTTTTSTLSTQGSAVSNAALTASSARVGPFGDRLRIRETIAGASGSPVGATYTITIIPCRSENN
jgi:hypothetical protein